MIIRLADQRSVTLVPDATGVTIILSAPGAQMSVEVPTGQLLDLIRAIAARPVPLPERGMP